MTRRNPNMAMALLGLALAAGGAGAQEPPPPREVAGVVLTSTGQPAPGAFVWLKWTARFSQNGFDRTFADERGRFAVPVYDSDALSLILGATHNGGTALAALPVGAAAIPRTTLRLRRPVVLDGRLIDTGGAALPGGIVAVADVEPTDLPAEALSLAAGAIYPPDSIEHLQARTDALGRFRLHGVPPASSVGLRLEFAAGEAPPYRLGEASSLPVRVEASPVTRLGALVAVRPAALRVETLTPEGAPAIRVFRRVRATPDPRASRLQRLIAGVDPQLAGQSFASDAAGVSLLEGLTPGAYDVAVNGHSQTITLAEGETGTLRFETPAAPITGHVLDGEGRPAVDAQVGVEIVPPDGGPPPLWPPVPPFPTSTNETGEFALLGAPWGVARVRLIARRGNALDTLEASPAALNAPVTFRLREGALVNAVGRLLDEDGAPLAGSPVHAFRSADRAAGTPEIAIGYAETNAQGGFELAGLPRGEAFFVRAELRSGSPRSAAIVMPTEGERANIGEVRLAPAPSALLVAMRAAGVPPEALAPLPPLAEADARAIAETMAAYVAALRRADWADAERLTHSASPHREAFLRRTSLRLPADAAALTAERLRPLMGINRLPVGLLFGVPDDLLASGGAEWAPVAYAAGGQTRLLGVARRDGDAWRVWGSLTDGAPSDSAVAPGEMLATPYEPLPDAALVEPRQALETCLAALSAGDGEAVRAVLSPASPLRTGNAADAARRWGARPLTPDGAAPAEIAAGPALTQWEVALLLDYPGELASLLEGSVPAIEKVADARKLYMRLIRYRGVAAFRYRQGEREWLALVARLDGRWGVWEPAIPW